MTTRRLTLSPAWRQSLPLLAALIAWILYCYRGTAMAMVDIWTRSETYAHAFLVVPISLWLIWRQRASILAERPRASPLLALPVAATTFFWLIGELTAVNALTQFALVATLVLAIMALLGTKISKRIAFPLAFLFFAVPFGDFMIPKLMEWTADFTVLALRATGIPVYQEGQEFVIPSGNWSVVEACSGIRYVIASVTIGTLFAYLNYISLRRRIAFIAVSLLVPVVANWLRAYMIVMLGHLSGNRLATGVDHLIYGWLFFGLVIMIMFMIGSRWREDVPDTNTAAPPPEQPAATNLRAWLASAGIALIATIGPLAYVAIGHADPSPPPRLARLALPESWHETAPFTSWKPAYADPSAEIQERYRRDGQPVGIYIAYYRNQDFEHKLVTSTNLLTRPANPVWSTVASGTAKLPVGGRQTEVRTAQLIGKDTVPDTRLTVWQWYWINGKLTASAMEAKLLTAYSRLAGHGDDSAVIMLYAPQPNADKVLPAFAAEAAAPINQLLAATRAARR